MPIGRWKRWVTYRNDRLNTQGATVYVWVRGGTGWKKDTVPNVDRRVITMGED